MFITTLTDQTLFVHPASLGIRDFNCMVQVFEALIFNGRSSKTLQSEPLASITEFGELIDLLITSNIISYGISWSLALAHLLLEKPNTLNTRPVRFNRDIDGNLG